MCTVFVSRYPPAQMAKAEGQPYEAVFVEKQFFEVAQISDGWRKRGEDVVTV